MIPALAARMREIVTAEPHAPHASCAREAGPLFLHLTRYGCDFALELNNEAPIPVAAAHTWAKACGAPEGTLILSMADGRIHRAEWQEDGFEPAGAASRAFYLGGATVSEDYTYDALLETLVRPAELDACRRERDAMRADLAKCVAMLREVRSVMTVGEVRRAGNTARNVAARWKLGEGDE